MRASLVAMAVVLAGCGSAQAERSSCDFRDLHRTCLDKADVLPIHRIKRGTPYAQARLQIMDKGFKPVRVSGSPTDRCEAGQIACEAYPEAIRCEGSAKGPLCQFAFEKDDIWYLVQTSGETARFDGATIMREQDYALTRRFDGAKPVEDEPILTAKRGTAYARVRQSLIAAGYRPDAVSGPAERRCSIGRDECETYPETIACSGTGRANCSFLFSRGSRHYVVDTYGEDALYGGARTISERDYTQMRN